MRQSWSSRDELLECLRGYAVALQARKGALARLSRTSCQIRSKLESGRTVNLDDMLERREQECQQYAAACEEGPQGDNALLEAAESAEHATDELGETARTVLSLHTDSKVLAGEIIACQNQCEKMLKERMEATSRALRESSHRRRLDAAYGPACKHGTPVFLDKQQ